ncbi:MAG: sulfite exporter TauE/SafE family protein [Prevotellaceae bacterium]|nr:sulfite exporter TauE/SafE family protein [Prevotellaceae bacterium]
METIILFTFCIGASFIQRVTGFGFGIFIMTALPYLMPSYGEATTLSGTLAATMSLVVMIRLRKLIVWKRLLPILISFLIISFFAIQFVSSVQDTYLKKILGCTLIVMSIYFLFVSERIHIRPTLPMQITMGGLSGIMGGLFAMQGPPAVLYFIASEKDKDQYMAMTQAYFFIGNLFMTIVRARNGYLTEAVGVSWLYAYGAIVIGAFIGNWVFKRISAPILRKTVYAYMAISGVIALIFS